MAIATGLHGPRPAAPCLHLIMGSGGSRTILAGAGANLAFSLAGVDWRTIGGVSGGSIPAAFIAAGMDPGQVARMAIDLDFARLLERRGGALRILVAFALKYHYEVTRPLRGVMGWEPLKRFMDEKIPAWPKRFWTMAVCGDDQIVFTADGVFRLRQDGSRVQIGAEPPPLSLAVCATCAVPGIIDAVPYNGGYLFDGALSEDGACPVHLIKHQFGARPDETVALDVGEDSIKKSRWLRLIWKLMCRGRCGSIDARHPSRADGITLIEPVQTDFHALNFSLSPDQKWRGLIAGFTATVHSLQEAGLLSGSGLGEALALNDRLEQVLKAPGRAGALSAAARKVLAERGLF